MVSPSEAEDLRHVPFSDIWDLLTNGLPHVGWCVTLAAVTGGFLVAAGAWLPVRLNSAGSSKSRAIRDPANLGEGTWFLPQVLALAICAGITTCIFLWGASLYATKSFLLGDIALGAVAIVGVFRALPRFWRMPTQYEFTVLVCTAIPATLIGVWHEGCLGLRHDHYVFFTDRYFDIGFHYFAAKLIALHGLPLINTNGVAGAVYEHGGHLGIPIVSGGLGRLSIDDIYATPSSLWIVGYVSLCWLGASIGRDFGTGKFGSILAGLSPLLFGTPDFLLLWWHHGNTDWLLSEVPKFTTKSASRSMYHNLNQTWTVVVAAGALLCYASFLKKRRVSSIVLCAFLMVGSTQLKPSLLIVFGPAIAICLAMHREWRATAIYVFLVVAGYLMLLCPSLLEEAISGGHWMLNSNRVLQENLAAAALCFLVPGLLMGLDHWIREIRSGANNPFPDAADAALVACGGGALFLILFTQKSPFDTHFNQAWPFAGSLVVLVPYVVAWAACSGGNTTWRDLSFWLRRSAQILLISSLIAGCFEAVEYPRIHLWKYPLTTIEAIEEARERSVPGTRFFWDPGIRYAHLAPYLQRPLLIYHAQVQVESPRENSESLSLFDKEKLSGPSLLLRNRDMAIVDSSRVRVGEILESYGWRKAESLPGKLDLWVNQARGVTTVPRR